MGKLTNQVAVVTGASKGIGAGIAKALAAEGASVVVNYTSSKEGANRVMKEITEKGGKAIALQGDVSSRRHHPAVCGDEESLRQAQHSGEQRGHL